MGRQAADSNAQYVGSDYVAEILDVDVGFSEVCR